MRAMNRLGIAILPLALLCLVTGCQSVSTENAEPLLPPNTYATPEDALKALVDASTASEDQMVDVFGSAITGLESADKTQVASDRAALAASLKNAATLQKVDDNTYTVLVGKQAWPFPIPLIKSSESRWYFDTAAGAQAILNRRVGANELATIQMMNDYVEAQRTYAKYDRTDAGLPTFAERFHSTAGKHDGLYWDAAPDEEQSPLGPYVAAAESKGYENGPHGGGHESYFGYYYKTLRAQGSGAPGGAYNYVINGHMFGGFAAVAWPEQYGNTGVMTFIVSQTGKVYQKDLGPKTAEIAAKMTRYDPAGWAEAGK